MAVLAMMSCTALADPGHGAPTTGLLAVLHEMAHAIEESRVLLSLLYVGLAVIAVLAALRTAHAALRVRRGRGRRESSQRVWSTPAARQRRGN